MEPLSALLNETDLLDEFHHRVADLQQAADHALEERTAVVNDNTPQGIARFNQANAIVAYTNVIKSQLIALARNKIVRDEFQRQQWPILISGFVGACAIATFAWAANPPTAQPLAVQIPSKGTVKLTDAGRAGLATTLGQACVDEPVPVIVLGGADGKFDLVAIPSDKCRPARFTLTEGGGIGALTPAPPTS